MGIFGNILNWAFGDDDETKKQYQKDIDDTMHIAFDPKESAMYDQFDELGEVPRSHPGDDDEDDGETDTPPYDDPPNRDGGGGLFGWLFGR